MTMGILATTFSFISGNAQAAETNASWSASCQKAESPSDPGGVDVLATLTNKSDPDKFAKLVYTADGEKVRVTNNTGLSVSAYLGWSKEWRYSLYPNDNSVHDNLSMAEGEKVAVRLSFPGGTSASCYGRA